MPFADFRDPSTLAALLVEAGLFGLAFAAALRGVPVRPVRWLARGLAALTLVLGLGFAAGMVLELSTSSLPFVLPEAALGTYAQMTQLGLLVSIAHFGLMALGAALAFRRPALGGLLLVISGLYGLLDEARMRVQDPTLPLPNLIFGLLLVLLVLAVGTLVLASWWAEHTGARRATPAPRPRRVAHQRLHTGRSSGRGR